MNEQNNQTKGYATIKKSNVIDLLSREEDADPLTDLIRQRVRNLSDGGAPVRNGYQPEREIRTGIGPISVKEPKSRAKDGKATTFRPALAPPYACKTYLLSTAFPY